MIVTHRAPAPWLYFSNIPQTIVRTVDDVTEMSEALCYGRDVTAHLSTMGMTIVKGR